MNVYASSSLIYSGRLSRSCWDSPRRATYFSLPRQRNLRKRKATRSLSPCASLRATCAARLSQDGGRREFGLGLPSFTQPVLAGLEKGEGDGLKNLDVRRQRSWLVSRFSGSFSFFKEPRSGPDCGSPFLWLLSFGEAKESDSPPGDSRHPHKNYKPKTRCPASGLRTYPNCSGSSRATTSCNTHNPDSTASATCNISCVCTSPKPSAVSR